MRDIFKINTDIHLPNYKFDQLTEYCQNTKLKRTYQQAARKDVDKTKLEANYLLNVYK